MVQRIVFGLALMLGGAASAQAPAPDPMANDAAVLASAGDTASQVAFAYADRNEDAIVSWEEFRNRAMRLFHHVDTNRDDVMQISEIRALSGPDAPAAPFDISAATFNAAVRKTFDDGDKNRDGALTPAEWRGTVRPSRIF
jgi:hypothetical protein